MYRESGAPPKKIPPHYDRTCGNRNKKNG
jgi:hypothetical protein